MLQILLQRYLFNVHYFAGMTKTLLTNCENYVPSFNVVPEEENIYSNCVTNVEFKKTVLH